jgi:hypothetical protein
MTIRFLHIWLLIVLTGFISGCGITLSPIKRRPLEITPMTTSLGPNQAAILVKYEGPLAGVPLALTVWDNEPSTFPDSVESKQIGFTQDYSKTEPVGMNPGAGGYSAAFQPDYTRIVIPFGRLFEGVFQSGLQQAFPHGLVCTNETATIPSQAADGVSKIVSIKVTDFQVWEKPLNHINLKASVECKIYDPSDVKQPVLSFISQKEMDSQSLASGLVTSDSLVRAMNKIANQFAGSISEDILEQLQKNIH